MTKFINLLALLLMATVIATAQQVKLEGVSTRGFSGVKSIDGKFYYTFYFGEKSDDKGMANFVLQLYDKDLNAVASKNLEINKNSELAASCFSGKYFLFIFADALKKTRTTFVLDGQGNIVKQKTDEDVRRALLMPDSYPDILALNDDEFLIIAAEKEKKFGYQVTRVDKDLNEKYSKGFFPEKGIWAIVDSKFQNGKLYLLRKEKPNALWGDKFTYSVQSINTDNGEEAYATALTDGDDGGFPGFISVAGDGSVATGGMYFADGKYDDKNSDGFFFTVISPEGKMNKFNKTPWKKVKDQIKGDFSSNLVGGKTKVLIEDLIKKQDGSYVLLGETFRKSSVGATGAGAMRGFSTGSSSKSGDDETGFTVMDFAFFNFSTSGDLTGIDKVEKQTREAVIKGEMSKENGLALAQWLAYKKGYFCYRGLTESDGKQYIMYKNEDGFKTMAYFLPVGATSAEGIGSIDMDKWVSEGLNKVGKLTKWTSGNKKEFKSETAFGEPESYEIYKNIIAAKPGYVLLYHYDSKAALNIWLEPVPAK